MTSDAKAPAIVSGIGADDGSTALDDLLSSAIAHVRAAVVADVDLLRSRNSGLARDALARLAVKRGTRRVGAASFATGFGGAPLLAVNLASVLTLQASVVLSVAAVYDELDSPDLKQDLMLIMAGNSAVTALRTFGVAATNDMGKRWVARNVTRETMKRVEKVVGRKILTKAGEKSLTSFVKLVPVAGAAVGYTVDRNYTRVLGASAVRYYSGA